ncbi:MAG: septum formation family protein, partial [Acidimicrobiales bacterium]
VGVLVLSRGDDARVPPQAGRPAVSAPVPPAGGDRVAPADLAKGDCFDQPAGGAVEVARVPCTGAHTDEVFAIVLLDGGPGSDYPPQIDDQADGRCYNEFVTFVGADPERSAFTYDWYTPTRAAWERGERRVPCVIADPDGRPLTGPG